jgi:O-antigen/teichoic acid export membrane protein
MREKYVITFIAEFLVLISSLLAYKLAAVFLGNAGFSEYALSRRALSLIQPALILGFGVAIPRYVAYSSQSTSKHPDFYFVSGGGLLLLVVLFASSVMYLFKENIAFLLFGARGYRYLIFPLGLMLVGIVSHLLCYTYFQGKLDMVKANVLQIINIAVIPLVAFLFSNNTAKILALMGVLWLTVSMISLFLIFRRLEIPETIMDVLPYAKELLIYGIQRVPGDFALAALLSLVAIFTAHTVGGVEQAGYVAFGVSILSAAGSLFAPIGIVLLPQASQMFAKLEMVRLRYYVKRILAVSIVSTLVGVIFFMSFADEIIRLYLGSSFLGVSSAAKLIALGVVPYAVFVSVRSILDSYYLKAVNAKNIVISLCLFVMCGGVSLILSTTYRFLMIGFVSALLLLSVLTLIDVKKIFKNA